MLDRRVLLLLLAAAVAAIVVVPGVVSGDPPKPLTPAEYRAELRDALDGFLALESGGEEAVAELGGKFTTAADRLGDVVPPAEAAGAHERLVEGLRSYGAWLGDKADASRVGAAEVEMQLAEHQMAGSAWIAAFRELAEKGYLTSPAP